MIEAINLIFGSEIILVLRVAVSTKVNTGLNMSDKHWFSGFHNFSLHFETAGWIDVVYHPNAIEIWSCRRNASDLSVGNSRAHSRALFVTSK